MAETKEATGPIILEGRWIPGREIFIVVLTVERVDFEEEFSRTQIAHWAPNARLGFQIGGFVMAPGRFDKRDLGPRAWRGFAAFFQELLAISP
jgi:hypothetical protein